MSHDELVKRAARWLRNTQHCGVVLTELHSGAEETPDAIGWSCGRFSHLVECKISVGDFYADKKKPGRQGPRQLQGIGRFRYYLAPPGILSADLVRKHRPRWGLLECWPRTVRVKLRAEQFGLSTAWRELPVFYSLARRIMQYGLTLDEAQEAVKKAAGA